MDVSPLRVEYRLLKRTALLLCMSNAQRLRVLIILRKGEATVNALADTLGISQSALSQHLARLRKGKLVKTRREAQKIYYSCTSPEVLALLNTLDDIYCVDRQ